MSATVVPCPGSRGSSTEWPSATMASAMGRIDDGLPVKPWITRQPTGPPATESGSASGRTSGMAGGYALQEHCQFERGCAATERSETAGDVDGCGAEDDHEQRRDRKSTRLNSSN